LAPAAPPRSRGITATIEKCQHTRRVPDEDVTAAIEHRQVQVDDVPLHPLARPGRTDQRVVLADTRPHTSRSARAFPAGDLSMLVM
jgi:hypothetical protein